MDDPEERPHTPSERVSLNINNEKEITEEGTALPREILIDILIRLPVKDLCKFRSVSKEWLVLISSDPVFLNMHTRLSNTAPLLLSTTFNFEHCENGKTRLFLKTTSVDLNKGTLYDKFTKPIDSPIFSGISSCFGLICFVCSRHVYVCNPSTHEFLKLPENCLIDEQPAWLGFIPDRNEYKVVNLFDKFSDEDLEADVNLRPEVWCEIFTVTEGCGGNSGCWRIRKTPCIFWMEGIKPVCGNGFIYWLASDSDRCSNILSLDLEKEEFGLIRCPEDYSDYFSLYDRCCLVELKGVICFVNNLYRRPIMNIWMLKDQENQTWVKEYSINFSTVDGYICSIGAMGCFPLAEVGGELLIQSNRGDLYRYNFENGIFKRVEVPNADKGESCVYFASFFALGSR